MRSATSTSQTFHIVLKVLSVDQPHLWGIASFHAFTFTLWFSGEQWGVFSGSMLAEPWRRGLRLEKETDVKVDGKFWWLHDVLSSAIWSDPGDPHSGGRLGERNLKQKQRDLPPKLGKRMSFYREKDISLMALYYQGNADLGASCDWKHQGWVASGTQEAHADKWQQGITDQLSLRDRGRHIHWHRTRNRILQ